MRVLRFVLVSGEAGIYLGNAMGLGFWSKWDPVGQDCAVTFPTATAAHKHVDTTWESKPADLWVHTVMVEDHGGTNERILYASIAECVAAGLPAWDPKAIPAATEFPQDVPFAGQFDKDALAQWKLPSPMDDLHLTAAVTALRRAATSPVCYPEVERAHLNTLLAAYDRERATLGAVLREVQRFQPAGSPPPGGPVALTAWVLRSLYEGVPPAFPPPGVKPSAIEVGTCLIGASQRTWMRKVVSFLNDGCVAYTTWDVERRERMPWGGGSCTRETLTRWASRLATPAEAAVAAHVGDGQ